jgi:hypothetical protein
MVTSAAAAARDDEPGEEDPDAQVERGLGYPDQAHLTAATVMRNCRTHVHA